MTKLEKALTEYKEVFHENYPLCFSADEDEAIDDIRKCIQSGRPAAPPDYEDDIDY